MSYFMMKLEDDFRIERTNYQAACTALKELISHRNLERVNRELLIKSCDMGNLHDALVHCRWESEEEEDGIVRIVPTETYLGDDSEIFAAIAPFVVENSFITMLGEEKEIWRWIFKNGTCIEETAEVVFESTPLYAAVFNWIYDGESGEELLCITTDKAKAQKAMKEQIEKDLGRIITFIIIKINTLLSLVEKINICAAGAECHSVFEMEHNIISHRFNIDNV